MYPRPKNTADNPPKNEMSFQNAPTSNPKVLKITAPGTSIDNPYFFSRNIKSFTSLMDNDSYA